MYKGRKTSKRIFTSLLTAALVMSTLEGATFSVSATQLETVVTEGQNVETKETEPATEAETELVSVETMETEVSVETEEDVTEEIVETETETKTETETEVETDTAVETEVMVETEETEDNSSVMMETLTVSEEYGDVLASGNCGATYQDESGDTKTYDVKWAVYDSNADGDNAVNTGDVLVISGSGEMENYSDGTAPWYSYGTSLKHLDVKSGVTSIGDSAFGKCSSLTAIELPVGVTSIGYCAFYYCSSLESIKLPVGLTSIGNSAFECCSSLASIELPNTLEKLGNFSFANCSSLTSIELPESVTSIGSSVFFRCSSLVNVELPESVTSIGNWLFANCSSLASIELPDNVTRIGNYAFYNCSSLVSIELPDSVSIIEGYAFYKCSSLERIELSAGVTSTGFCAFADCSSLVSIELPDSMISIEKSTFYNCSSLTSIKIPKSVTSIGANACFGTNSELKIYTQSSDWCDTYAGTNWGNSTVEVVKPYRISYQLGETENTIAEVYADGIRSYTFKEGEPPEEYVWYDEGYNNGRGLYVQSGMTVENIRDDITLVQADMDGFYVTKIPEQTYTGKALKPEPAVYDCNTGKRLEKGKDYTVTYKNNVNAYTLTVEERSFDYTKAPRLIIKGKGNYDKSLTLYFTIQPKNIGDKDIIANDLLVEYTGKVQKKVPVITYNNKKLSGTVKPVTGQTLKNSKDFVYSYPALDDEQTRANAYKENGTYGIFMEGTGNFTGSRTVNMTIISKGTDLTKASIKKIPEQTYTGKKIILEESRLVVTAKVNGKNVTLKQDTDYSVSYKNNKNVGTATVTITGKGDYTGTKTATFKIKGTSLTKAKVSGLENKVYNGEAQTQQLTLELSSKMGGGNESVVIESVLREGKDYTVSYDKNVNVGTAKITITGKGGYTGTIKKTFKITPYNFAGETDGEGKTKENSLLTEENGLLQKKDGEISVKYMKGGSQPAVQLSFNGTGLTAGKDYTVTYSNHKKVSGLKPGDEGYNEKKAPTITIKGKGNFTGNIKKIFIITAKDLQDSEEPVTIIVADKAVTTKKGGYISKPVLTDADGKVLKAGTDYETPVYTMVVTDGTTQEDKNVTLGTKDTVEAGAEVTVTVKGKGAYTGELTATYRITEKNFGAVKVQSIQKDYTGKEVTLTASDFAIADGTGKGVSKVTFGSGKNKVELEYGKDFEIVEGSYRNNLKKGTASVTLRGLGEYGGTKTIKFKIGVRGFFWWLFK